MKITKDIYQNMINHAKKLSPIECCGYLASENGCVIKHYELTNIDNSPEHFSFDPKEQFATVKDARSRNLEVTAVYHSHPETPARPSQEDIRLAYDPNISYVIVSLVNGTEDIKSFRISEGMVTPEVIEIIE